MGTGSSPAALPVAMGRSLPTRPVFGKIVMVTVPFCHNCTGFNISPLLLLRRARFR